MIDLQSADVGSALSRYFNLSGQGRLPMGMEQAVVPVVLVGDVSANLRQGPLPCWSAWDLAALAANFGCYSLINSTIVGQRARRIFVEKVVLYTQTTAFFRFSQITGLATTFKLPAMARVSNLALGAVHGSLYADNAPVGIPQAQTGLSAVVTGNQPFVLELPPTLLVVEPGGRLDINCTTANLATSAAVLWHEEEI